LCCAELSLKMKGDKKSFKCYIVSIQDITDAKTKPYNTKRRQSMRKTAIVNVFLAFLFILTAGCATMQNVEHKYFMKGQILDVSDGEAYLCIGSAEGAQAGQEFAVYRHEKLAYIPKGGSPSFKREEVGAVKIIQVVDVHFAKAKILRGDVKVNDVAELSP
jgi:hypothetical protein